MTTQQLIGAILADSIWCAVMRLAAAPARKDQKR